MTDLDDARLRLVIAEDRLEASKLKYLAVLAAARRDFEQAKAEREAAMQALQAAVVRERMTA